MNQREENKVTEENLGTRGNRLLYHLYQTNVTSKDVDLNGLLKAINLVFPSKMSSLWKVNHLAKRLSVVVRIGFTPSIEQEHEFVHDLDGSLIGYLMKLHLERLYCFYDIPSVKEKPYINFHKSPERVSRLKLKRMISIPIPKVDTKKEKFEVDAFFNFYPSSNYRFSNLHAEIISNHFSKALAYLKRVNSEKLTQEIISIYKTRGNKNLQSVLHPLINRALKNYCNYEGCSVFLWDHFTNRLSLCQSTGIFGMPMKSDVFYFMGDGITGYVAEQKDKLVIEDIKKFKKKHPKLIAEEKKWEEHTKHDGLSFMWIPIMSPSRPNELLGVIRFVNKLNSMDHVVDYFNQEDYVLISHACNLIALYMEYEQIDLTRIVFAMQMAHEMLTPAFAIKATADRLCRKWNTVHLTTGKIYSYISSIQDFSDLQIALTRTVEFASKRKLGIPRSERYQVEKCGIIGDVLKKCKKLVIPISRMERLTFQNIEISGKNVSLYIDRFAFEQVFFNLFTNSIKYRDILSRSSFGITVHVTGITTHDVQIEGLNNDNPHSGCMITVKDYGIGINEEEKEKIFSLGYRAVNIQKSNVRGLGLGLNVAKNILEDFHCKIWVANCMNPTTFKIFVPNQLVNNDYTKLQIWTENYSKEGQ